MREFARHTWMHRLGSASTRKNLTGSMPARFYLGFLEKTGRNRVTKGCGGSGERLQNARTSSERLRLSRTAKRSGAVVTGRLVKRAQVAHPYKSR